MKNSRLWALFHTLDKKEVRECEKFIRSPFYNHREDVVELYQLLEQYNSLFGVAPSKAEAFARLFPEEPYDDHRLRMAMSLLNRLLELYLVQQKIFEDELFVQARLAEVFRQRNLNKRFRQHIRKSRKQIAAHPYQDADLHHHTHSLEYEAYLYASARKRTEPHNLQAITDHLDIAYLARKLRQSCLALAHQAVYRTQYEQGLLPKLLESAAQPPYNSIPAVAVYYHCYQALSHPAEAGHFKQFKAHIFLYGHLFPPTEARGLYLLAINYCARRINEGQADFSRETLGLYKKGLENKLLFQDGRLSRFTYRNIVTTAIMQGEYSWAEQFIHHYRGYLPPEQQEAAFSLALARLEYERQNYGATLALLQKTDFKDLLLNLAAKTVLLKTFYQLQEFESLHSHLAAMRTYINRKKIIGYHRENYLNLINSVQKLLRLNPYEREGYQKLREEVQQLEPIAEKKWLLEQIL